MNYTLITINYTFLHDISGKYVKNSITLHSFDTIWDFCLFGKCQRFQNSKLIIYKFRLEDTRCPPINFRRIADCGKWLSGRKQ